MRLTALGIVAVPALIVGVACSSESAVSEAESTTAPSYPKTADSFRMQAKGLSHAYDTCVRDIAGDVALDSQCRYAAEVADEKVRALQVAAESMRGGWPMFVAEAQEILDASKLTLQSCTGSFDTISASGNLNSCITAGQTIRWVGSSLEGAVTLETSPG
ncbi:hypothetical protein 7S2_44 [uncultured Caudovirales phage]|uniref:Uncharacterized protein n=1 Tax=uncultured Caudovirales phage TaxID=2100421 RepID=A0A2H4JEM9_9CAUD|nr:hypothetical protein 7S2_44 [uncultured Caudovirales phage]